MPNASSGSPWGEAGGKARSVCRSVRMGTVTRVVLDTNVLVAAAYNSASASRRIVETCLDGQLTPALGPACA